ETLSLDDDPSATQANLQKFVDAYNHVMQVVQAQFNITGTTDTSQMLTNDPALRGLQGSLANLVMKTVGSGAISSLADLGVETEKDGSLSLDSAKMTAAMTANPEAVNRIFQDATQGIGKAVDSLVQGYTDPVSGILTLDSKSLNDSVSQMDDQIASLQVRVNAYHDNLLLQFTQMEQVVSSMKSVGNYLTAQDKKS
ncbi:MAG: flagellar filament capping protein FliD, partial [Pseudomonadota bacterium]